MAAHAYSALDSYIYGFAFQRASPLFVTGEQAIPVAESVMRGFPSDHYPYMAEIAIQHVIKPGYSFAADFEFGLELILDGLENARQAG
jgi:hypothetical protein